MNKVKGSYITQIGPNKIILFTLLLLLTLLISCSSGPQKQNKKKDEKRSSSKFLSKEPLQLSAYKGTKLMVVFWASWCPPCIKETPTLIDLQRQYGSDSFTIIGVSADESPMLAEKFMDKMGVNFPVHMQDDSLEEIFGPIFGFPTTFWLNASGKIVGSFQGARSEKSLQKSVSDFVEK